MRSKELPPGIDEKEAGAVELLALDFLNAYEDLSWEFYADATLVFSKDGLRAEYNIDIYTSLGYLAATGSLYSVEMEMIGGDWVAIILGSTGFWLSKLTRELTNAIKSINNIA